MQLGTTWIILALDSDGALIMKFGDAEVGYKIGGVKKRIMDKLRKWSEKEFNKNQVLNQLLFS